MAFPVNGKTTGLGLSSQKNPIQSCKILWSLSFYSQRKSKALVTSLCSHSPGQQQENYPNDLALYKENIRNNAWEKGCRKSVIKVFEVDQKNRIIQENTLKHHELFSGQLLDFGFENSHSRLHKLICYILSAKLIYIKFESVSLCNQYKSQHA